MLRDDTRCHAMSDYEATYAASYDMPVMIRDDDVDG